MFKHEESDGGYEAEGAVADYKGRMEVAAVRVELPPRFTGDGQITFAIWVRQFETAACFQNGVATVADCNDGLAWLLPTRLAGAAFLLWDSLPLDIKGQYALVKEKLSAAFGQRHFLLHFQTCVSARKRQHAESLEVYAADITRLVSEAFPEYGQAAQRTERFRRFLAGLDPELEAKCHEHGAMDMEAALEIASRCERARLARGTTVAMAPVSLPQPAVVAPLQPALGGASRDSAVVSERLVQAMDHLVSKLENLEVRVRDQEVRACRQREHGSPSPVSRGWDSERQQQSRRVCRCDCGAPDCRGRQRDRGAWGPSPRPARDGSPRESERREAFGASPRRREDGAWRPRSPEDRRSPRTVRFTSPSRRSPSPGRFQSGNEY